MVHPHDDSRRERADADRLDDFCRCWPADANFAAGVLGLILAEKLLGWRPPWRRSAGPEVPGPLILSLSRRRPALGLFRFKPPVWRAAND